MGQKLSSLYFHPQTGKPNLLFLTFNTALLMGLFIQKRLLSFSSVSDDSMAPYLSPGSNILTKDVIWYSKHVMKGEKLKGKIVAVRDPFSRRVVFRRVIADELMWVQRMDDGGIIQVPSGHVWIEQDNNSINHSVDSLTSEIGGPITINHVLGPCEKIVWPIWRATSFNDMNKFNMFITQNKQPKHSKVFTSDEIYDRYGIM